MDASPFILNAGMRITSVDHDSETLAMIMPLKPEFERQAGSGQFHGGPIASEHPFNSESWDLAPEVGLLVLFPSRLDHSVLANGDPESLRCSISFDFVITAPEQGNPPEYLAPHPSQWTPCSDLSS